MECSNTALLNQHEIAQVNSVYTDTEARLLDAQQEHDDNADANFRADTSAALYALCQAQYGSTDDDTFMTFLIEAVVDPIIENSAHNKNPVIEKLIAEHCDLTRPVGVEG